MIWKRTLVSVACLALLGLGAWSYDEVDFGAKTTVFFVDALGGGPEAGRTGGRQDGLEEGRGEGRGALAEGSEHEEVAGAGSGRVRGDGRGRGGGGRGMGHRMMTANGANLSLAGVFHYTVILSVVMMLTVVVDRWQKAWRRRRRAA